MNKKEIQELLLFYDELRVYSRIMSRAAMCHMYIIKNPRTLFPFPLKGGDHKSHEEIIKLIVSESALDDGLSACINLFRKKEEELREEAEAFFFYNCMSFYKENYQKDKNSFAPLSMHFYISHLYHFNCQA